MPAPLMPRDPDKGESASEQRRQQRQEQPEKLSKSGRKSAQGRQVQPEVIARGRTQHQQQELPDGKIKARNGQQRSGVRKWVGTTWVLLLMSSLLLFIELHCE